MFSCREAATTAGDGSAHDKLIKRLTAIDKIKVDRVLLAGFLSGLVYLFLDTFFEGLAGFVFGVSKKDIYFEAFHIAPGGWRFHAVSMAVFFVQFILFMWIYAAVRPRFRSTIQGALAVALVAWVFALLSQIAMVNAGIYPVQLAFYNLGFGLFKLPPALLLGSFAYQGLKKA